MTELFDDDTNADIVSASKNEYPSIELSLASKADNAVVPFAELTERRHAVRSYSDEPVTRTDLEKAVTMSLRTPSVCNRQPARIRIFTDRKLIGEALKVQGGFGGYNLPPALVLVTADLRVFMGTNEHNEDTLMVGCLLCQCCTHWRHAVLPPARSIQCSARKTIRKLVICSVSPIMRCLSCISL